MKDNQVWCLIDLPLDAKTIGSKWLFKKKTNIDGNVHTYKSCLVAKGYTQTYRIDYEETFSPIADIRAIRILIAIATIYDYEICKMDVKTANLNGYLYEDIYMVQPDGYVDPKHPRKIYDAYNEVACLILGSMTPELHRQFENSSPYEMIRELKSMFEKQAGVERFKLIQTFHACKQEEGKPVGPYVLKMKGFVEQLERLGYVLLNKRAKHNLDSTYLWHCRLAHISKKRIKKLQHDRLLKSTDEESFDPCLSIKMTKKPFPHRTERATDLLGIIHTDDYALETATRILNMVPIKKGCEALMKIDTPDKLQQRSVKCIFIGYPKETMGYYFYFPPKHKIVVAMYAKFLEKNLLSQEISGRAEELEEIQDEDTSPSENTSDIPMEVEGFEPPQEEVIPIRRSARTHRAPDRLCLNVEVEEHSLGDLNEPTNYKAAILDPESDKWVDCFVMKDLGEASFILRIKIYRDRSKLLIGLSQSAYMVKILKRFRMDTSKRGYIPMQERLDLNKTQGASTPEEVKHMQNVPYASAVGSIMYGVRNTKDMFLVYGGNPEAEIQTGRVPSKVLLQCLLHKLNISAALEAAMEAV
ncbi:retrotransposon protein, putative, ty1-copia subclass [Tanacetum coccineum]